MAELASILNSLNKNRKGSHSIVKINEDYFNIELWVHNLLPDFKPLQIPFLFLESIVIEESLLDWNTKGYFVMENYYEMLERGAAPTYDTYNSSNDSSGISSPFSLRTDGRNKLNIKIKPLIMSEEGSSDTMPPQWEMNFDFVIYDVQDVSDAENAARKLRAYYFKDERHQILSERQIEWSTGSDVELNPDGISDSERSKNGNEIISKLLQAAALVEGADQSKINVGYDPNKGSIDKPTIPLDTIDSSNWDPGPSNAKFFYTSPAHCSVLEDIEYIISKTKATDGSPVLLDYGRNSLDKSWKLHPLSYFFNKAEENQIEKLFIDDGSDASSAAPHIERASYSPQKTSIIQNFTSSLASKIKSYHFSNAVSLDMDRIINRPTCYYDQSSGTYHIKFKGNTAEDVLGKVKNMTSNLYTFKNQNGRSKQIIFNLNQTKSKGISTIPALETLNLSTDSDGNNALLDLPAVGMAKDLIFLNQAISFQVPGLTFRTPGKYIYIDRPGAHENLFDNKFLGQWLLVTVKHFFSKSSYTNEIVAVKPDAQHRLWEEKENIY